MLSIIIVKGSMVGLLPSTIFSDSRYIFDRENPPINSWNPELIQHNHF